MTEENWSVEIFHDGRWHTDTTGERVFYTRRAEAAAWAARLTAVYRVRLRHTVIDYAELSEH